MKNRRGSLWVTGLDEMIMQFKAGDIVKPVIVNNLGFVGVVRDVDPRINKVFVSWGNGSAVQHDPDEIQLVLPQDATVRAKMASRRVKKADKDFFVARESVEGMDSRNSKMAEEGIPHGDNFVGDPETHGIDEPRGGGFSIMQDLAKDLHKESTRTASERRIDVLNRIMEEGAEKIDGYLVDHVTANMLITVYNALEGLGSDMVKFDRIPLKKLVDFGWKSVKTSHAASEKKAVDISGLKSRRAMYWGAPDRTYRLTKQEQESGSAMCPKCKENMDVQPFTKRDKLFVCPVCGFKVPKSKTVTNISIEVKDGEVTDVDVTTANGRRGKMAAVDPEKLAELPRLSLADIALLVYGDWKPINYAARPYLEAMATLQSIKDDYGQDSGTSIVAYFLGNATSWRGEVAKAVKKELNRRLKAS